MNRTDESSSFESGRRAASPRPLAHAPTNSSVYRVLTPGHAPSPPLIGPPPPPSAEVIGRPDMATMQTYASNSYASKGSMPAGQQQSSSGKNVNSASQQPQPHVYHQPARHPVHTASLPASSPGSQAQQPQAAQAGVGFPPMAAGQPHGAQPFQRLKVEDALSYLDQVKYKFGNQPQVYNDFLDIMKEFKSQSIDTPGVIARVSSLFRGHPELIVGFNTFLPPGYKIEVQANEQVSVSVPGSLGVPAHVHHITHMSSIVNTAAAAEAVRTTSPIPLGAAHTPPVAQPAHQGSGSYPVTVKQPTASPVVAHPPSTASQPYGLVSLKKETGPAPTSSASPHHSSSASLASAISFASAAQGNGAAQQQPPFGSSNASQPVEFNHAINYVNKIKNRFQGQPDIYKQFLEILHTYQKEQRALKEGLVSPLNYKPTLTEAEVYAKVAQLFQNQEDLLQEFGQFLPDATSVSRSATASLPMIVPPQPPASKKSAALVEHPKMSQNVAKMPLKRSAPSSIGGSSASAGGGTPAVPSKKLRLGSSKEFSAQDGGGKYGSLSEYAFFDKVRRLACRSSEVYDNFLRLLVLYNQEVISKVELLHLVTPFLSRHADLLKWFREFLGVKETPISSSNHSAELQQEIQQPVSVAMRPRIDRDLLPKESRSEKERESLELDYSTCKRLGASYCALPKNFQLPKCSGRTQLCKEVLNDTWVSFPSWSSEDSTFVSSRKTQYEEYIYRAEDERFELDVVLETHMSTIRVLEGVMRKLSRMSPDDASKFKLDDCLGGSSPTIHVKAIRRIYGEKAPEIIEGLKRNPAVAVPIVLRRMKAKEEEWREAQKGFNKIWRDQNEKYYLKSLDHMGTNFKQNDVKSLRSKALINEIETIFEERNDESNKDSSQQNHRGTPHLNLPYKLRHKVIDDAADLLIYHAKRQTSITKEDKRRIKTLLRHTVPDLFRHPRQELSEDEREEEDDNDDAPSKDDDRKKKKLVVNGRTGDASAASSAAPHARRGASDDCTVFFGNDQWYIFLRLHQILSERLGKIWEKAALLLDEERQEQAKMKLPLRKGSESVAVALRLKPKADVEVEQYYSHFLTMVKNVLDGNLESSSFEDQLREMFGIHAYVAFTLDKVIANAVRQLSNLVSDETCVQCTELFLEEHGLKHSSNRNRSKEETAHGDGKRPGDSFYQRKAEQLLSNDNMYKIVFWHKETECNVTIELLDTDSSSSDSGQVAGTEPTQEASTKWPRYLDEYATENGHLESSDKGEKLVNRRRASDKPVCLRRNLRQWEKRRRRDEEQIRQPADKGEKQAVAVQENSQCLFNVNSYPMVFVVNSESFLYKRHALTKAKQCHKDVSLRMRRKFRNWHQKWKADHVTPDQEKNCTDWLMGTGDASQLKLNVRTRHEERMIENRAPYGLLVKYRVDVTES